MAASASTSTICLVEGLNPPMTHRGYRRLSYSRQDPYIAFYDIRYAAPPEGLDRCKAPRSFTPDESVDQSTPTGELDDKEKMCIQPEGEEGFKGTTDCLYLNVYLPKRPEEVIKKLLLPVLVYFHGGGFRYGCNAENYTSPDFIVQHGLVFVTVNYRLGALGFLNLGTEEVPGNAGLKDQVKALEWIRDNIICFGGDPSNVTISGNSAGASCVNLHMISETSKDLFHKAIVQSGGIYCPWGIKGHQRERKRMLLRDETFKQLLVNPDKSVEFQKHAAFLLTKDRKERHPASISSLYGPTVEKIGEGAFIPCNVETMMEMKMLNFDKPVMAGITKEEGISHFRSNNKYQMYLRWMEHDEIFCKFLVDNLRWSDESAKNCFGPIKQKYFPPNLQKSPEQKRKCLHNFFRDIYFHRFYDNFKFGPNKTLPENLYVYRFDHVSEISAVKRIAELESFHDATHCDEVYYMYCPQNVKEELEGFIYERSQYQNPEIKQVTDHLCSLWANFCKHGVPKSDYDSDNVKWRCHTDSDPCFLSISKNLRLIEEPLYEDEWGWLNAIVASQETRESAPATPEGPDNSSSI